MGITMARDLASQLIRKFTIIDKNDKKTFPKDNEMVIAINESGGIYQAYFLKNTNKFYVAAYKGDYIDYKIDHHNKIIAWSYLPEIPNRENKKISDGWMLFNDKSIEQINEYFYDFQQYLVIDKDNNLHLAFYDNGWKLLKQMYELYGLNLKSADKNIDDVVLWTVALKGQSTWKNQSTNIYK